MKMRCIYTYLFALIFVFIVSGCDQNNTNSHVKVESQKVDNDQHEKIKTIFYSIPSPLETTIILKRSCPNFSPEMLFPDVNIHSIHDNHLAALYLGVISTDLNYAMLSERKLETNQLLNQVMELSQILHLDGVINPKIKERIENNMDNKDSMQIIIGNTFWDIENKLKMDENLELSSLMITGGWVEGLYLASSMSKIYPENNGLKSVIVDQKFVHQNLMSLIRNYQFNEPLKDSLIPSMNNLSPIFEKIKLDESNQPDVNILEKEGEIVIGNYFNLKFEDKDLIAIHDSIVNIRQLIITQLL